MKQETIKCPYCGKSIELSEALSHDLELKLKSKYDKEIENLKLEAAKALQEKDSEMEQMLKRERKKLPRESQERCFGFCKFGTF